MARRNSYLNSMDTESASDHLPYGTLMSPITAVCGGPLFSNASTRNGSIVSHTTTVKSEEKSRKSSAIYSEYSEEEGKNRKPSFAFSEQIQNDVSWALYMYTSLLGLNEGFFRKYRALNKVYCNVVIVILFLGSFRRFQQIGTREPGLLPLSWGEAMFDPTTVLTICNAVFLFSGALAATFMLIFRKKRNFLTESFKTQIQAWQEERNDEEVARRTVITVILCLVFSFVASSSKLLYKIKALQLPWLPPLISDHWYYWPVEFYVTFIAESAISILTIFFSQSCTIIRFSIQNLLKEMVPEGDHEECPLPEESLRRIRKVQIHHQELLCAKMTLEDHFSSILFYSYGVVIPVICFLGYLIVKNLSSDNWAHHISLGMWILTHIAALLMISIPAFMIHEDGEKLLSASFKMYHEGLCEERDLQVVSQMTLLVFQIHSARLTLSASNYFSMNRKILISLFSAIFTYFLILVQFGQTTGQEVRRNSTVIYK